MPCWVWARAKRPPRSRQRPCLPRLLRKFRKATFRPPSATERRIQLNLSPSGSFVWTTIKDGKTSQFQGTFSLAGGQLQLQRADKHNLEGVFTPSGNGFNLKLQGQTDGGLNFVRV